MNVNREKAVKFLSEYGVLCKNEKLINEQMCAISRALESLSVGSASDIQAVGGARYGEYLIGRMQKADELKLRRAAVRMRKELITGIVDRLPERQRTVICRFFLSGDGSGAADDLSEQLSVERSQVYRIRGAALDAVYEMMSGSDPFTDAEEMYGVF